MFITEDRCRRSFGPFDLVQVVVKESLYFRKPIFVGLNLTVRVAQKVSKSHKCLKVSQVSQGHTSVLQVSHKCLKVLESKQNRYLH